MAGILAFAGPLASIGGSLFGMANSGNMMPPAPNLYQFGSMPTADTSYVQGVQQMQQATDPLAQQTLSNLYNNPYAGGAQMAGNVAGGMGMGAGMAQYGAGMGMVPAGMSALPYANMALQAGFDPQNQVYNQLFQQQTDQTRAAEAARGIANTPYGAGVEAQSDINFNTAWQQNLMNRMGAGSQAASNILGAGTGAAATGLNTMAAAPGTFFGGGSMPYNTAQTIGQNQYGAITGFQGIQQQPLTDWMQYLGGGTQAQGQQVQLYGAEAQAAANQAKMIQSYGQGLGSGLQGLSKAWGSSGPNWGASNPGVAGSSYYGPVAPS